MSLESFNKIVGHEACLYSVPGKTRSLNNQKDVEKWLQIDGNYVSALIMIPTITKLDTIFLSVKLGYPGKVEKIGEIFCHPNL